MYFFEFVIRFYILLELLIYKIGKIRNKYKVVCDNIIFF